jgi:glycosyltransferase involved in cell wall biosynthesis
MKIAAVIDLDISSGGGFNQSLNAIIQLARITKEKNEFEVYTNCKENIILFQKFSINVRLYRFCFLDSLTVLLRQTVMFRKIQKSLKWLSPFEKNLIKNDVDLVYFVTPSSHSLALQVLNYIFTVWDISYRECLEFPEVRNLNEFLSRDYIYKNAISQALLTICDSISLAEKLEKIFSVDASRLVVMPFSPSAFINKSAVNYKEQIIFKYGLTEGYYFYPAQFWAHKNHVRILQAYKLNKIKNRTNRKIVFSGRDFGNLDYIKKVIESLGLIDDVKILGFVPEDHIQYLYSGACAVVMPTYFGPTNIPPLEAWLTGKPLIYSKHLHEQVGNAAILVDPDSERELADAMLKISDHEFSVNLIKNGYAKLKKLNDDRKKAEKQLVRKIESFSKKLNCWKTSNYFNTD